MIYYSNMTAVAVGDVVLCLFSNNDFYDLIGVITKIDDKIHVDGIYDIFPVEISIDTVRGKRFLSSWSKLGTLESFNEQVVKFTMPEILDKLDTPINKPDFLSKWNA